MTVWSRLRDVFPPSKNWCICARKSMARCDEEEMKVHEGITNLVHQKSSVDLRSEVIVTFQARGFFGEVFRGIWNGTDVTIKVFIEQDPTTENMEDFFNEIYIMRELMCIHHNKIVHRDLKSANYLVNRHWTVKTCDFTDCGPKGAELMGKYGINVPRGMVAGPCRNSKTS